jgi:DNA-binding PadR family transcriptional regulator
MSRYQWGWHDPGNWGAWTYPPWSRRGRFFGSGEARLAILSLLGDGPKNGYELMKELEARSGGTYKMSAGTMYPALQQLEDEGLIVPDPKDGKKLYALTDLGRQELERESATVDEIWRRASHWGDWAQWMGPGTAMIAAPLGGLMKAAFKAATHCGGNPAKSAKIEEILNRARKELDEL